jgi:pilus assembly protein Flp/PilA
MFTLIVRVVEPARVLGTWVAARLNVKSERGATAVEYGLMVALIAAVIIAAVALLGTNTSSKFDCVADAVGAAPGGAAPC